jgi:hypothetical protein
LQYRTHDPKRKKQYRPISANVDDCQSSPMNPTVIEMARLRHYSVGHVN